MPPVVVVCVRGSPGHDPRAFGEVTDSVPPSISRGHSFARQQPLHRSGQPSARRAPCLLRGSPSSGWSIRYCNQDLHNHGTSQLWIPSTKRVLAQSDSHISVSLVQQALSSETRAEFHMKPLSRWASAHGTGPLLDEPRDKQRHSSHHVPCSRSGASPPFLALSLRGGGKAGRGSPRA
jgi:hypothetical protein